MERKTHDRGAEKRISECGGSSVSDGGSEKCFGLGLEGKRLTVGKNRSDSETGREVGM